MKIVIASTIVPFIEGGGTFIVDWLDAKLKEYGHQSEILKIPFYSYYPRMLEQMLALRMLDLTDRCDRLITIRTPSYLIRHPDKYLWFIHHHRQAYDLWGTKYQDIPSTPEGLAFKNSMVKSDNLAFQEAKKIYTNSKIVSTRLRQYNNIKSEVVYPPLLNPDDYYCKDYGNYILYVSRIAHHKRQQLAVEAMRYVKSDAKLIIAGSPDSPGDINSINKLLSAPGINGKVKLINRWITKKEKINLFASSLATIYIPFNEDSYGYPSLESFQSKKAVITCSDSGGTLELIKDGINGFVAEPNPKSIAESIDRLYYNKQKTVRMGKKRL